MAWLALDIGGAHIKLADGRGFADAQPFALWKHADELAMRLRRCIHGAPVSDHLAVTMTGELADCFETKTQGVDFILDAVQQAADNRHIRIYMLDGALVAPPLARDRPRMVASSNWHALARFCGQILAGRSAVLLDVGSTTCDIIPIRDGQPAARGVDDTERLLSGELVYTGVVRSPVCAVVRSLPIHEASCPVAQEVFATTRDVYLLTGDLPEEPQDHDTADGRPATRPCAVHRMGRMISAWVGYEFGLQEAIHAAQAVAASQVARIAEAVRGVLQNFDGKPDTVVISGQGAFLAPRVLAALDWSGQVVRLDQHLGPAVSRAAPAHALAVLAGQLQDASAVHSP